MPPPDAAVTPAVHSLTQTARVLERLFLQLSMRQRFLAQSAAAAALGLVSVPLPQRPLKERPTLSCSHSPKLSVLVPHNFKEVGVEQLVAWKFFANIKTDCRSI